mgnify:CR=1 FL=1
MNSLFFIASRFSSFFKEMDFSHHRKCSKKVFADEVSVAICKQLFKLLETLTHDCLMSYANGRREMGKLWFGGDRTVNV